MIHTPQGYKSQKGFVKRLKVYSNLYDKEFSENYGIYGTKANECITPVTPFGKRVFYRVDEFDELIDSSNLTVQLQIQMA